MNFRMLQYLVALADHQHFGRAAQACHVSQPTLSMQFKKLEEWLDLQLLERTNRSVRLTTIGFELAERARCILQDVQQLKAHAQHATDPMVGECRLGMIPTIGPYLLPNLIPKLSKALPDLACFMIEGKTEVLIQQLQQNDCDLFIAALPLPQSIDARNVATLPLFEEHFFLAVNKDHPLAKHKSVSLSDIDMGELLLLEEGHCLRDQALEICQQAHLTVQETFKATSLETLRHMVAAGRGVTLLPALTKLNDKTKQVVYIPFSQPFQTRTVGLCWRQTTARRTLFEEIGRLIQTSVTKQADIQTLSG